MKTTKLFFMILLLLFTAGIAAQQQVILQSAGTTRVFGGSDPFNSAYNAAATGDTIYLPGGNLPYPGMIDKGLVIYGAGFNPDSTVVTKPTVLGGGLYLSENADNFTLEGIQLTGDITTPHNHKVDNLTIKRCKFNSFTFNGDGSTPCQNNLIKECIITGNIHCSNVKNSIISNNIIQGRIFYGRDMVISNNLFLLNSDSWSYTNFHDVDNSLISNNVFTRIVLSAECLMGACESNTFRNNVFYRNPAPGFNTFEGNYTEVDVTTLFVNQTGTIHSFTDDYHLKNPATYPGTDGTQVGIYGGAYPFKTNTMPSNPHISFRAIPPHPDSSGNLQVKIKVSAQND